ncbi:MAG: Asp-tRNA(Asn)/Glu-tRNA(Gln) amidotransferase GatCAB subunit A [Candidatus Staskawiczbacteria bacterium CG10_big_fil_rev_8_21_14_0_10_38_10]|uniref:Glutamyl-tRNA(Gln) amidotransferase subunit A n=1 Tax=Candidatus Staskawiczbacteria bacterium CG10_big_fil_rev_8_21_14_0_10_38_10 TaxID=1974891 RepID=A0A2H9T1N1_9BACT|nr:MAG: Asp-tRNA(Asn)/Glu-tRNA(Gln) amidotransferase GatCAB subunit A [Candidatus Staskawiczbacteria bacterium CG10_big_fil_rev_8_21_14_0_10_38_10]
MGISELNITKIHEGLNKKDFSALELNKSYLKNIKEKDKEIFAFLTITEDLAIRQAQKVDELIHQGKKISELSGVPLAVKDNILIEGVRCTAGSKILENYTAPYDATVIEKLKAKGAIILGKTNLDEFAMGSSTENSAFQITRNPSDLSRVPGGSSGGSAAAVAAKECCYALGSDTGGSIRQPASFCGVVGLKPTYGAVSRYGLIAFASSLDQVGPITKTVEDCEIVFNAIKGKDEKDSTSVKLPESRNGKSQMKNLKIGVPKEYFGKGIESDVESVIRNTLKKIQNEGAKIEEISLPYTKYALATYYIIAPSEASANLARYDGIKYGYSNQEDKDLLDTYLNSRGEGFGDEVKRRIILGTYSLCAGYYDAYYLKAQKVRNLIIKDFEKAFEKVDLIFTPVSPVVAFKRGERIKDPLSMYLADINTISINLAGLPALSLPCGEAENLPVGIQIIGKYFEEDKIFQTGKLIEEIIK